VSWEYGQLATEIYELDKAVGRPFPDWTTTPGSSPAGSIMLLDGQDAAPRTLAAFREALVPGGRLILDVDVPSRPAGPAITSARYWERDPYLWTMQVMHTSYDPVANQETSLLRYEKWRDGGLVATGRPAPVITSGPSTRPGRTDPGRGVPGPVRLMLEAFGSS
jgi:hypothetical protein